MAYYRVVYGETMPAWERTFPTKREADAFTKKHRSFGDVIFSVRKVDFNEAGPHSLMGALAQAAAIARTEGGTDE